MEAMNSSGDCGSEMRVGQAGREKQHDYRADEHRGQDR